MTGSAGKTTLKEVIAVNETHAPAGALTTGDAVARSAQTASRWPPGRIAALAVGVLLGLFSLALLTVGGTALWADSTQRSAGYVMTGVHGFSSAGSALATEPTELGSSGVGWLYGPGLLGKVRIKVEPTNPGSTLFVGIGPSAAVDRYLAGVNHTLITDYFGDKTQEIGGGKPGASPAKQYFWVASTAGVGARTLLWSPKDGSWSVVVMNADGRPGIGVRADLGAEFPDLLWITIGLIVGGAVFAVGSALLIRGSIRRREALRASGKEE
jgi:hypothetical protein